MIPYVQLLKQINTIHFLVQLYVEYSYEINPSIGIYVVGSSNITTIIIEYWFNIRFVLE